MAHYAKVVDNTVTNVIVADEEFFKGFVDDSPGRWIQTSYNTRGGVHYQTDSTTPSEDQSKALRKNYAGLNYNYDAKNDAFYEPQPYASWILNKTTYIWEPPISYPTDGKNYSWDESNKSWLEVDKQTT